MPIARILIENFRSIERCEIRPSQLTALVGENNAGKTNILRAAATVLGSDWVTKSAFDAEDFRNHDTSKDILIELEFDPPLKYRAFAKASEVDIPILRYKVSHYKRKSKRGDAGDRRLETGCFEKSGKPVMVLAEAPKKGQQNKYKPLTSIPDEVRAQVPLISIRADRRLADQLPGARASLLRRMFGDVHDALQSKTVTVHEDGVSVERPAGEVFRDRLKAALEVLRIDEFNRLEEILRARSLENLGYDPVRDADRLRFHFDLLDPMDFYKAIKLLFREGGLDIEATEMGDGVQNALVVAVFQAYEQLQKQGAIFLIEEPEMYLHPHRQRYFFETLRRISQRNQVIYTTHSPHFVALPDFQNVRIIRRNEVAATTVCVSSLSPSVTLHEKLLKEFDPERNELFFARHVVLVEGDTEKLALPEYARRMPVDLNRAGVSIVEVGGKKNLKTFAQIVASFDIPLTLVFDTDSGSFKDNKKEEEAYNAELRGLASAAVRVLEHDPDYEGMLRKEVGEQGYQALCQRFPGVTKAVRQRLIAADGSVSVPAFVSEILDAFKPLPESEAPAADPEPTATTTPRSSAENGPA